MPAHTPPPTALPLSDITGVVLAGGRGSRMGGVDKGLQLFRGEPLAVHALTRLRPQVASLLISANRHLDDYRALAPVITDGLPDFPGPLAGILTALQTASTPFVACVPCDSPFFPSDLVARLSEPFLDKHTGAYCDIAIAVAPDLDAIAQDASVMSSRPPGAPPPLRSHPVFALMRTRLAAPLAQALAGGERRLNAWRSHHNAVEVIFDDGQAFYNMNTLQALAATR